MSCSAAEQEVRNAIERWSRRATELDGRTDDISVATLKTCNRQIGWLTIRLGQIAQREEKA